MKTNALGEENESINARRIYPRVCRMAKNNRNWAGIRLTVDLQTFVFRWVRVELFIRCADRKVELSSLLATPNQHAPRSSPPKLLSRSCPLLSAGNAPWRRLFHRHPASTQNIQHRLDQSAEMAGLVHGRTIPASETVAETEPVFRAAGSATGLRRQCAETGGIGG